MKQEKIFAILSSRQPSATAAKYLAEEGCGVCGSYSPASMQTKLQQANRLKTRTSLFTSFWTGCCNPGFARVFATCTVAQALLPGKIPLKFGEEGLFRIIRQSRGGRTLYQRCNCQRNEEEWRVFPCLLACIALLAEKTAPKLMSDHLLSRSSRHLKG